MSILFSLTGSIQPSIFSFFQTNSVELEKIKSSLENKILKFEPVLIQEDQGYMGTISNYYNEKDYLSNIEKQKKSPLSPNPGKQDNAFLSPENDVVVIKGSIKFVNNFLSPTLTDSKEQKTVYTSFVNQYIEEFGLNELISRYLKNIISGKILWRNKFGLNKLIDIEFKSLGKTSHYRFDTSLIQSLDLNKDIFVNELQKSHFNQLVSDLSNAIKNSDTCAFLNVQYFVEIGFSSAVFPSQLFLDEKPENKGRCLSYQLIEKNKKQAVLHSQKIANAIRTIDNWYEDNSEAIPVEVYGVVVTQREAHRPSGKNSFYDFFEPKKFKAFVGDYKSQKSQDKHYLMSMFIKGGVFGI